MNSEFQESVDTAFRLIRKRDYEALGRHELTQLKILQKRLPASGRSQLARITIGKELHDLLSEVIEGLALPPGQQEGHENGPEHQQYLVLRNYVIRRQSDQLVAHDLHISRATLYKYRQQGTQSAALLLWEMEQDAKQEIPDVLYQELPKPPYVRFIERYDRDDKSYVEKMIDTLTHKRAWIVIIDGPAGVGKTALAYKVVVECIHRGLFDALVWVSAKQRELSPVEGIIDLPRRRYVTSLEEILDTIGKTIDNKREILSLPTLEAKRDFVRKILHGRNCLIVVDNLEDLPEDTFRQVKRFLQDDLPPPHKVLLTSRERHYVGEYREPLAGMNKEEAFEFMEHQAETRNILDLNDGEMEIIFEQTDGLPLAMKYALGQVAVFGRSALDDRDSSLQDSDLLHFMFEEAYKRLNKTEKRVLHLISLLVESASVEAIWAAGTLGQAQVQASLEKLYKLFLVERDRINDEIRYRTLPNTNRFLESQRKHYSRVGGEFDREFTQRIQRNFAEYYTKRLTRMSIDESLSFLKNEKQNILAVLNWCYEEGEASLLIDLVEVLGRPLGILGYVQERLSWGLRAMEVCEKLGETRKRVKFAISEVAWVHIRNSQNSEARTYLESSLALARKNGYDSESAMALHNLGRLHRNEHEIELAIGYLGQALEIWGCLGDKEWQVRTAAVLGQIEYDKGNLSTARSHLEKALEVRREIGHVNEIVEAQADLSLVLFDLGEETEAGNLMDEALFQGEELPGPSPSYAYVLYRDAKLNRKQGRLEDAKKSVELAYDIYSGFGVKYRAEEVQVYLEGLDAEIAERRLADPA